MLELWMIAVIVGVVLAAGVTTTIVVRKRRAKSRTALAEVRLAEVRLAEVRLAEVRLAEVRLAGIEESNWRAFWLIRGSKLEDNVLMPDLPAYMAGCPTQVYCDLRVFGPGPAPADHKHAQIGPLALGTNHYHWMFWHEGGGTFYQDYVGSNEHTHSIPELATHFVLFLIASKEVHDQFLVDYPNALIVGYALIEETDDGLVIGDIDNTTWLSAERQEWETRTANFGIELPEKVTNDRRLARWLLSAFEHNSQNIKSDKNYRYTAWHS